jgi:dTDP-4-amino-4,6-dideoxygalactose transaminase
MENASREMIDLLDALAESYKLTILEQTAEAVGASSSGDIEMF